MSDDKTGQEAQPLALTDDKTLHPGGTPDEPSLAIPEGHLSNLWLLILGSAFFTLWALNASAVEQTSMILPVVAKEFGVSSSQVQWIAATNTIVWIWGSLQIVAGRCCDIYGRKKAFHCGMVFWTVATILSSFMPNLASLNVCRGFAGIGAAVVLPAAAGMIGTMYPSGRKRTLAFVAVTCGGASGAASGLLIAGALLEYSRSTWRPVYLVIGLAYLWPWVIVTSLVPADLPHAKKRKLDWLGSLLLGLSLFLLLFGFTSSQTERKGWPTPYVPVLIVGSGILMGLFVLRQIQLTRALASGSKAQPLIPRALLSLDCWNLLVFYLASMLAWASADTYYALIAYLYLDVLELRPLQAGLRLSVVLSGGLAAALGVAVTINWVRPRLLISIFCGVQIGSPVLMAIRRMDWPYWYADLWSLLLLGLNTDVLVAAGLTLVSLTAPIEDGSVAAAIFQTSCRVGYAIGLAIATLIQTNVEKRELAAGVGEREALAAGVRGGFWFCTASAAASTLVVLFGMRRWQKLSEMKQGEESPVEVEVDESPVVPRTSAA